MDADLSLILGPIVLAVVFNVRPVRLAPPLPFGLHLINRGPCTERVSSSGTTTILPGTRIRGTPSTCTIQMPSGGGAHKYPQAPRRMGLLPGHLPHGCGDVHVVGICGTELWKSRDLSSPPLVSLLNPRRDSPRTIESLRQAVPNHPHLQYVISLQRGICTILLISPPQL